MDTPNASIAAIADELQRSPAYRDVLISSQQAENIINKQSMLVVTDTQTGSFTTAPRLLSETDTVVVIDHHVRGAGYIDDSTLMLHEPYASSACEMVTEITQYFGDDLTLTPVEAEALLAGIMIDTKGFSFKTGARTFDAASYLRKMGADTTRIRHLFQDDLETFNERAKIVQSAKVYDGVAVAVCPPGIRSPQLLTAQAADSLLSIRGIGASFVLCGDDDAVIISGRSLGDINVQRILEKLGGGGHATIAGAQLKNETMQSAGEKLQAAINEYRGEV
jgi:c-di-AMP phosphodiesterase-like protein